MNLQNTGGKIFYGLHFYPGVAEYQEGDGAAYRVYLNENTLREMDPSFAGKPIFVEHVDEVERSLDKLRSEADGWVIESFYNQADGKHWVKFITVTERAERAIRSGMRLSNAYLPTKFGTGGLWNGVQYEKEVTAGEYDHLAIVSNPRYEESKILTPEQFKQYNQDQLAELKKISNSGNKGESMKLNFFKRSKVENAIDPDLLVALPKSGKEMSLVQIINAVDESMGKDVMANPEHKVKLHDGSMMNVGDLVEKHKAMYDELEAMKKEKEGKQENDDLDGEKQDEMKSEGESEVAEKKESVEVAGDKHNEEEDKKEEDKKKNDLQKSDAKKKADALRDAPKKALFENQESRLHVDLMENRVARGRSRYGS